MLRLPRSTMQWVLAISMACLLLAWPLHQAGHASEPVNAAAQAQAAAGAQDSGEDQEQHAELCLWCLFHAQHHAPGAPPTDFHFHAEVSAPPTLLPAGQPRQHSPLAADPRGPPRA